MQEITGQDTKRNFATVLFARIVQKTNETKEEEKINTRKCIIFL